MLVKTDSPGYLKDSSSGVVINTNTSEYDRILLERRKARDSEDIRKRMDVLENKLDNFMMVVLQTLGKVN